ncbi:MAG TPA: M15 family metallopeptidase, partial [Actinomycetota bacterium]|nr:M15 family metallopeptidase [Actinomycetota bacterium]
PGIERSAVARRLTTLLDPGQRLRLRFRGETPFLRYGDAVLPQLLLKEAFGEFAARPLPGGTIEVESPWRERNIVRAAVPILGRITCHRSLFPQLRDALEDVDSRGLGFTIDPGDFGGCYSPRFIGSDVNGRLSHHSWGIAFDLNASENPFGTRPNLDERLIEIFESHGFTWGGRWLIPDGMHFEWVSFPSR